MRIRIVLCQRHCIRRALVHPFEVAIIVIERRHPQVFGFALVGRLMKINPLLRPRRSPSLRSLRCRIRIRIIPQRPRRGITLRRPAAARTGAAGAVPRTPSILQRSTPRSSRRILSREWKLRRSPTSRRTRTRTASPARLPVSRWCRAIPREREALRRIRSPGGRSLPWRLRLPIRRRCRSLLLCGILAVRPEYGLPTLIRKRTATLLLRTYCLPRQHHPNAGAHQPQSPQPAHPLHISIRRHPAPAR